MNTEFGRGEQYRWGGVRIAAVPSDVAAKTSITMRDYLQQLHKYEVRESLRHTVFGRCDPDTEPRVATELACFQLSCGRSSVVDRTASLD